MGWERGSGTAAKGKGMAEGKGGAASVVEEACLVGVGGAEEGDPGASVEEEVWAEDAGEKGGPRASVEEETWAEDVGEKEGLGASVEEEVWEKDGPGALAAEDAGAATLAVAREGLGALVAGARQVLVERAAVTGAWGDAAVEGLGAAEIRHEEKAAGRPAVSGIYC